MYVYYTCVFGSYLTQNTASFIINSNQTILYGETVVLCIRIVLTLTCIVWAKCKGFVNQYGEGELVFKSLQTQAEHLR
jgi:hypothetical protein